MESQLALTEAKKKEMCWLLSLTVSVDAVAQLDPVVHMAARLLVSHLLLFRAGFTLRPAGRFLPH